MDLTHFWLSLTRCSLEIPLLGMKVTLQLAMVISQGRNLADYSNDADSNYFQADFFIGN